MAPSEEQISRSAASAHSTGNSLLDRFIAANVSRFQPERVTLHLAQELYAPGDTVKQVYFPISTVCSIVLALSLGQRAEMGTVGSEGIVGIAAALHTPAAEYAVVQIPGEAYTVSSSAFRAVIDTHRDLHMLVLRYIAYAYRVSLQSTLCNAYHTLEQRLARWLLACHDCAGSDAFPLTQELLSHMVAATRPRVSEAANRLRAQNVIDYQHGTMRIRDRRRLESLACECYEATRRSSL